MERSLLVEPTGDLYVLVQVAADERFIRDGEDLITVLDVPAPIAALGAKLEVSSLSGPQPVEVPAGTQPGAVILLRGQGMPVLRRPGRSGDLKVGVGAIRVVPPEEATFRVSCSVPEDALGAAGPVTCPHPLGLASTAMTCSVVLADPGGGAAGQGFCRRLGAPAPPAAGAYATTCTVPADSDGATCAGLSPSQLIRLQGPPDPDAPPATALSEETTPTTGTDVGLLRCGPPEADGSRTCTGAAPAATTTTAPATYRCIEAQDTRQLTCVSALG